MSREGKLTKQQSDFVNKYLECGNASEAYRFAYPKSQKWKDEAVWAESSKLLKNTKVALRVTELQGKTAEKAELSREGLIGINQDIINADFTDYIDIREDLELVISDEDESANMVSTGKTKIVFKDIKALPLEKRRLIQSITISRSGSPVITLMDKDKAVERLNKMLGYDAPKEASGTDNQATKITVEIVGGERVREDEYNDKDE